MNDELKETVKEAVESAEQVFDGMARIAPEAEAPATPAPEPVDPSQMTPAELLRHEEELEEKFYADPENKKNALVLASQIKDTVGKNWFTFNRFLKKTKEDKLMGLQKLNILERFGLVRTREGNIVNDGRENRGLKMYKVFIDNQDYLDAFDQLIAYHQDQIRQVELAKKQYQ